MTIRPSLSLWPQTRRLVRCTPELPAWFFPLLVLLSLLAAAPARAEYHALVIGNAAYPGAWQLANPDEDAGDLCGVLKDTLRFPRENVTCLTDVDATAMATALEEFGARLKGRDLALFYFSGHGFHGMDIDGRETNFLVGKFASPVKSVAGLRRSSLSSRYVLDLLAERNGKGTNVMILDACRDLPQAVVSRLQGKGGKRMSGFSGIQAPSGFVIAYATALGKTALGGGELRNSVYTAKLLEVLREPGALRRNILSLLNRTGQQVEAFSAELLSREGQGEWEPQVPWLSSSPVDFCFKPPCEGDVSYWQSEIGQRDALIDSLQRQLAQRNEGVPQERRSEVRTAPEIAHGPRHRDRFTDSVLGQEFVYLQGDCFQMGSPDGEKDRYSDERQHRVCVDSLWLATTEVTNAQFRRFRPGHDSGAYEGHSLNEDRQPVVQVSWADANAFVAWLNAQHVARGDTERYGLPSEAQWEYAARAGTSKARFWGDDPDQACVYANVRDRTAARQFSWQGEHECDDGQAAAAAVGTFRANPWGLQDMLGNVWEWTCSLYQSSYDGTAETACPGADDSGLRVLRGGSWNAGPGWVRSADRLYGAPTGRYDWVGFRLARIQ